jgi:hypothetical protein
MATSQVNHRFLHITEKTTSDAGFLLAGRGTLAHKHGAKRTFGCFDVDPPALYMGDNARITSMFTPAKQLITVRNRSFLPCNVDMAPNKNPRVRAAFKSGSEYNKRKVAPGMAISIEVSVKAPGASKRRTFDSARRDNREELTEGSEDNETIASEVDVIPDEGEDGNMPPELLDTISIRAGRQVFAVPVYAGCAQANVRASANTEMRNSLASRAAQEGPETVVNSSLQAVNIHQLPHMPGTLWNTHDGKLEWRRDRLQCHLHPELEFNQAIGRERVRHHQHEVVQLPRHLVDVGRARAQVPAANKSASTTKKKKVVRIHPDVIRMLEDKERRDLARRQEQCMLGTLSGKGAKGTRSGGGQLAEPLAPVRSSRPLYI